MDDPVTYCSICAHFMFANLLIAKRRKTRNLQLIDTAIKTRSTVILRIDVKERSKVCFELGSYVVKRFLWALCKIPGELNLY